MSSKKLLLFKIALILVDVIAAYHSNDDDTCKPTGHSCNPDDAVPCCEENVPCLASETPGMYICTEEETIGADCIYDYDCRKFRNTKCLKHKCACGENFIQLNASVCAPILDQFCIDEVCAVANSACIDYKCQCRPDYLRSHNRCIATRLNQSCGSDADCDEIPFAECSLTNTCVCKSNYVKHGQNQCLSGIGGVCSGHSSCAAVNSLCIDNECQCRPKHTFSSNSGCVPIRFNGTCRDTFDCQDILNTICSEDKKCVCDSDSIESKGKCVPLLGGFCFKDGDCIIENSACIDNICQCTHNQQLKSHGNCAPKSLGMTCKMDRDCNLIKNAKCSADNICVCNDKYFAKSDFLCSPIIGGSCANSTECFFNTLECIDNKCQCSEDSTAISSSQCVTTNLLFSCQHISECADSWHSQCLNNKCVCKSDDNISLSRSVCLPLLGGACWKDDQCIPENSGCIDFVCQCKPDFAAAARNFCVKV